VTAKKQPTLDIVIVNWNTGQQIRDCVQSIADAAQFGFILNHVFVVDNASTDGSMGALKSVDVPLTTICNSKNRGFAVACNQGARAGHADYILFLNPDTQLFSNSLHSPIAFMQDKNSQHIGICGIHLVGDDGEPTIAAARFPSLRVLLGKMSGLAKVAPTIFPTHMMGSTELQASQVVDQIIGAYFLMHPKPWLYF